MVMVADPVDTEEGESVGFRVSVLWMRGTLAPPTYALMQTMKPSAVKAPSFKNEEARRLSLLGSRAVIEEGVALGASREVLESAVRRLADIGLARRWTRNPYADPRKRLRSLVDLPPSKVFKSGDKETAKQHRALHYSSEEAEYPVRGQGRPNAEAALAVLSDLVSHFRKHTGRTHYDLLWRLVKTPPPREDANAPEESTGIYPPLFLFSTAEALRNAMKEYRQGRRAARLEKQRHRATRPSK
jgi:hypothetical protein